MNGWGVTNLPTHLRRVDPQDTPSFSTNAASKRFKGISKWCDDTVVSIPDIESFKKKLIEHGMR
jgi:hypothetical protein